MIRTRHIIRRRMAGGLPTAPAMRPAAPTWLLALCAALGCSMYRTSELPKEPAHAMENVQTREGLAAAAQFLGARDVAERYAGEGLRARGYFAVLVALENRGERSFQIERRNFTLVLQAGERFKPSSPRDVLRDMAAPAMPLGALLLAPLVFPPFLAYSHAREYNFDLAQSLQRNSFPRFLRLEPGDPPFNRILFFRETRDDRPASEFDSAVLEFVAELEGSAPEAQSLAGDEKPGARQVGRSVTFTLSLTQREL